jgi:hypothetical protein
MSCTSDDALYPQTFIISLAKPGQPYPINGNGHLGPPGFSDGIVDLSADETHVLMSALEYRVPPYGARGYWQYNLMSINLENGGSVVIREGMEETGDWIGDGTGNIVARVDVLGPNHREILVATSGRDFRPVADLNSPDAPVVAGLTEDGNALAALVRSPNGTRGLYPLDLKTGVVGSALYNTDYDVTRVLTDDRSLRVVGVNYYDGNYRSFYLSPERQRLQKQVEEILPGRAAHLMSMTADGKKALVLTTSP